jgi:hypothetical protein
MEKALPITGRATFIDELIKGLRKELAVVTKRTIVLFIGFSFIHIFQLCGIMAPAFSLKNSTWHQGLHFFIFPVHPQVPRERSHHILDTGYKLSTAYLLEG